MEKQHENKFSVQRQEIDRIHSLSSEEFANWLIDKHDEFAQETNWQLSQNFLDGDTSFDKYLIIVHMYKLLALLDSHEIEHITKEVSVILLERNEADLFMMLNTLGYIR